MGKVADQCNAGAAASHQAKFGRNLHAAERQCGSVSHELPALQASWEMGEPLSSKSFQLE